MDSDDQEYFLGAIVTIPGPDGVLDIIDGQQRLATMSIVLSRIRAFLLSTEPGIAKSIESFLSEYDRHQRTDVNKLKLNLTSSDFLESWSSSSTLPPPLAESDPLSHRRLRAAFVASAEYVKQIVSTVNSKGYGDRLNRWIDFIEKKATIILFRVPSRGNAYKMFETLNDRGLRTTQADLVKNYLFGRAGDREEEAMHSWGQMTGALSSLQGDDVDIDDDKEDRWDLEVLVFLGVRMLIAASTRTGSVEETMGKAANAVLKEEIKTNAKLKEALADITPSNPQFSAAFETATLSKGPLARYYLRSLEQVVQRATYPWFVLNQDREAMTLEHVLQEEPAGNWAQITAEEHAARCRRLGNLCLLPKGENNDLRSARDKTKFVTYRDV